MNQVLFQYWEESERGWGVRPDGASLHISLFSYNKYIKSIYNKRNSSEIPDEYDRIVGKAFEAKVSDDIYSLLLVDGDLRITQYQLNNLIKLKDIEIA